MDWTAEYHKPTDKTPQYLRSGDYAIDIWDDWFEVRWQGMSVEKTDRLTKAIMIAELDAHKDKEEMAAASKCQCSIQEALDEGCEHCNPFPLGTEETQNDRS